MAYKVTCPSCEAVVESAFVRVGAVTRCPSCGMRYAVREQDLRRPSPPTPGPLASVVAERRATDEASAPGLSGLSDLMKRQDQVHEHVATDLPAAAQPRRAQAVQDPGVEALAAASAVPARRAAAHAHLRAKKRRQAQVGLLAAAAAFAVIGVILLIVLVISGPGPKPAHNPLVDDVPPGDAAPPDDPPALVDDPPPAPGDPADPSDPPVATDPADPPPTDPTDPAPPTEAPAVAAQALAPTPWQDNTPPVLPPDHPADPIRVTGVSVEQGVARVTVISDTLETIDLATVQCHLLNADGRAVRTASVPVLMLAALEPTTVRIPLPEGTAAGAPVAASASVQRTTRQVYPVQELRLTPDPAVSPADGARIDIEVVGRLDTRARRLVVVLEALDASSHRSVGTWRVEHGGDLLYGGLRNCTARINTPLPGPVTWAATAHALR